MEDEFQLMIEVIAILIVFGIIIYRQFYPAEDKSAGIEGAAERTVGRQPIPKHIEDEVLRRDDYRCRYCRQRAKSLHIDHVVPVSQGGGMRLTI